MNHNEIKKWIRLSLYGELTNEEQSVLESHLKECDECRNELEQQRNLLSLISDKKNKQILIGFAAESENLVENAKGKLKTKNLDYIIANDISNFASNDNEVSIISENETFEIMKAPKVQIAKEIIDYIINK